MSIPLVKKLDLDSINTSIIAIKRLLQQAGVSEGGTTIINNNNNGGVPLGTWASFENDSAPNGEWLQGGSSFDPNTYPALAMMLGGNTVPEMFDHNRPSDYERITISSSSSSPTVMLYDGEITLQGDDRSNQSIYINGIWMGTGGVAASNTWGVSYTYTVKKGDEIYVSGGFRTDGINARWYKHPLFIKATPTSSDSDYEGTLNVIRTYVENKFGWRKIADRAGSSSNWATPVEIPSSATEVMINGQNNADWDSTTDGMNCLMIIPTAILTDTAKPYTPFEPTSWGYSNCTIRVKLSKTQILWAYTNNSSGATNRKVSIWYR